MPQNLLLRQIKNVGDLIKAGLCQLAPCSCLLCAIPNRQTICPDCVQQFFSAPTDRCVRCAIPLGNADQYCGQCLKTPPAFSRTIVACDYRAPLDELILALKFRHQLAVAPALAQQLALATAASTAIPELLMPVPLSRARLVQRGFNQSLEIARPLARLIRRPLVAQLLHRVRDTTAQTLLHPDERRENILHAFSPDEATKDRIRGRHIGVVDDVITTGATLNEIAACLKRHGAVRVTNLVFARTPPH